MRPSLDFYCVAQNGNGNPIPIRFHHESTKNHFRAFCPQLSKLKNCPTSPSHHFRVGFARSEISTVKENQVVLLSGETGCGKSTQVTHFEREGQGRVKMAPGANKEIKHIWVWINIY
jgi:hypothetical protein